MTTNQTTSHRAIIAAYRTHTGATHIQIVQLDDEDCGFGHRLAGPKHHNMGTTTLVERTLDAEDAREIRAVLNAAFPPAPADVTVYELRVGTDDDPSPEVIARYATTQAASAHGEDQYRAKHGNHDTLEWPSTGTDDAPRWRLEVVDDLDGDETLTDWHIVAVTIPAAYVPAGGAR